MDKIDYFLKNEEERAAIARNAHDKVAKEHTFDVRVQQILELVSSRL
jgi:spore maturation protein CgeB